MSEVIHLHYDVDGSDFASAGNASVQVKRYLREIGLTPDICRKVSIAMYEGEINMVIHADGGVADVYIDPEGVKIVLADTGPGIPDIDMVMREGYSTASPTVRNLGFGAGMGLPNMKRNSDEMRIDTVVGEGTTITMVVKLT